MSRFSPIALLLLLLAVPTLARERPYHYLVPNEIDCQKVMPDLPPLTEEQWKMEKDFEISLVMEWQQEATPADLKRAREEAKTPDFGPSPFSFSDVLGDWFKPENTNISALKTLLQNAADDAENAIQPAKRYWKRLRPFRQDPKNVLLQTDDPGEVPSSNSGSYPSGHGTDGLLFALVLSDVFPQLKEKLVARGVQYGNDRVILGVHFPSDVAAGRALARAVYSAISTKPSYQDDVKSAQDQLKADGIAPN